MNTNNPHHESLLSSRSLLATVRPASSLQCQGIIPCWQSPTASSQQCYSHCELPLKPDLHSKVEGRTQLARLPQIPFRLHIGMPGNSLHSFSCPHPHSLNCRALVAQTFISDVFQSAMAPPPCPGSASLRSRERECQQRQPNSTAPFNTNTNDPHYN